MIEIIKLHDSYDHQRIIRDLNTLTQHQYKLYWTMKSFNKNRISIRTKYVNIKRSCTNGKHWIGHHRTIKVNCQQKKNPRRGIILEKKNEK